MPIAEDDWRRLRIGPDMVGRRFTRKNYQAMTGQWQHEHCLGCWRKFLDPNYSEADRKMLRDDAFTARVGFTNLADDDGLLPGRVWLCQECFDDFKGEYRWTVVETDPDAWPYAMPEPDPRPTSDDWTDPGSWLARPE